MRGVHVNICAKKTSLINTGVGTLALGLGAELWRLLEPRRNRLPSIGVNG